MKEVKLEMEYTPTYYMEELLITAHTHTHKNAYIQIAYMFIPTGYKKENDR